MDETTSTALVGRISKADGFVSFGPWRRRRHRSSSLPRYASSSDMSERSNILHSELAFQMTLGRVFINAQTAAGNAFTLRLRSGDRYA